jgi:hypothetical protein
MSILQRQLRIFLAAFLVAGLLLAGIATGQAVATPCGDGDHYNTTVLSAQLGQVEASEIKSASDPDYNLAACCSMFGTTCCTSAAFRCDDAIAPGRTPVRSAWLMAATSTLHGRGHEVNRRPPRLA